MVYWDTSALLKLYVMEEDSSHFDRLLSSSDQAIATSTIAVAEIHCVAYRKESAGELKRGGAAAVVAGFQRDCRVGRIVQVPFGEDVMLHLDSFVRLAFGGPRPVMLRALDAIHVASAVSVRARSIVATDLRLRAMALRAGLAILP